MALPISAARSANMLKLRMDYCCQATKKVQKLLANASALEDPSQVELLQEIQDIPASYHEFNNGVMALDLRRLEEGGVFKRLEAWFQVNLKFGIFNNDQHAWNLAAMQDWQDLQKSFPQNSPSLDLLEASLQAPNPTDHLKSTLRGLSFVHYTNQPKPWKVNWADVEPDALFDDRIWQQAFHASGSPAGVGSDGNITLSVREVLQGAQKIRVLRPSTTANEDFEYGMLYMEGSGGLQRDPAEARWRFARAAQVGDAQSQFMIDQGLDEELQLPDKAKLTKLERCWALSVQRIRNNEDHQTLRALYKLSEQEYHARKAPAMVSSCYWRLQRNDLGPRPRSTEELEQLFSATDGRNTPVLTPKLSKWLELVAKDQTDSFTATGGVTKHPPVELGRWTLLPALGWVLAALAGLGWRLQKLHGGSADRRDKKKKRKSG
jgi:lipopolysaccharide biosynthesis glycosyltransferase